MPQAGPGDVYAGYALSDMGNNPGNELGGVLAGGQAVNVAGTNLTVAELMQQLGDIQGGLGQEKAYAELGGQYAGAQSWLGQEQLGLQAQGLGAQEGLLNTQYGIQQKTLAGQENLAATQFGLSQADLAAQKQQQALSYGNQVVGTQNQAAASGALNTAGSARTQGTNALENQFAQGQLQRQGIGEQAAYNFQKQQFGLEQQGQAAQQAYSLGDIARGEQGLQLSSQANGLSLDQTMNQINYGMEQAGYGAQQSKDQLYGQIGQAIGQGASYTAGEIGYQSLLSGVNLNQFMAGQGQ